MLKLPSEQTQPEGNTIYPWAMSKVRMGVGTLRWRGPDKRTAHGQKGPGLTTQTEHKINSETLHVHVYIHIYV